MRLGDLIRLVSEHHMVPLYKDNVETGARFYHDPSAIVFLGSVESLPNKIKVLITVDGLVKVGYTWKSWFIPINDH